MMGDLDDISDNEGSEYNEKIEGEDDDEEYDDELDGKGRRRRGKRRNIKKQPCLLQCDSLRSR